MKIRRRILMIIGAITVGGVIVHQALADGCGCGTSGTLAPRDRLVSMKVFVLIGTNSSSGNVALRLATLQGDTPVAFDHSSVTNGQIIRMRVKPGVKYQFEAKSWAGGATKAILVPLPVAKFGPSGSPGLADLAAAGPRRLQKGKAQSTTSAGLAESIGSLGSGVVGAFDGFWGGGSGGGGSRGSPGGSSDASKGGGFPQPPMLPLGGNTPVGQIVIEDSYSYAIDTVFSDDECTGGDSADNNSVDLRINVGAMGGWLRYSAADIDDAVPNPTKLVHVQPVESSILDGAEVILANDSTGVGSSTNYIRQIVCADTIMEVRWTNNVYEAPTGFAIDFYSKKYLTSNRVSNSSNVYTPDGPYVLSGSAIPYSQYVLSRDTTAETFTAVHKLYQMDGALKLAETTTFSHVSSSNEFRLSKPGFSAPIIKIVEPQDSGLTNVTKIVRNTDGSIKYSKTVDTYINDETFGCVLLVHKVYSDETTAFSVTNEYYLTGYENDAFYGQPKAWAASDNSWAEYDYNTNGHLAVVRGPWRNSVRTASTNAMLVTTFAYTNLEDLGFMPETIKEYAPDQNGVARQASRVDYVYNTNSMANYRQIVTTEHVGDGSVLTTTSVVWRGGSEAYQYLWNRLAYADGPDGVRVSNVYQHGDYRLNGDEFVESTTGTALRTETMTTPIGQPSGIANKTTKSVTVDDEFGRMALSQTWVYTGSGFAKVEEVRYAYDARGNLTNRVENGEEVYSATYDENRRRVAHTDASGVVTTNTYDSAGRIQTSTKLGVSASGAYAAQAEVTTTYAYDMAGQLTQTVVSASGLSLTNSTSYDWRGRPLARKDEHGLTTTYTYDDAHRSVLETRPGGATVYSSSFADGSMYSVTGTAVVASFRDHGLFWDGSSSYLDLKSTKARTNSPAAVTTRLDWLGRTAFSISPDPSVPGSCVTSTNYYNSLGQVTRSSRPGGQASMVYSNSPVGEPFRMAVDIDGNGLVDVTSMDIVEESSTVYTNDASGWWLSVVKVIYPDDSASRSVQIQQARRGLVDAGGHALSETRNYDVRGQMTRSVTSVNRLARERSIHIYRPGMVLPDKQVYRNGLLQSSVAANGRSVSYAYDSLGRQISISDSDTGISTKHFNGNSYVDYVTDAFTNKTSYGYSAANGQLVAATNAVGQATWYGYDAAGRVTNQWGGAVYPVAYSYDEYGRIASMSTFRTESGWSSTTWPGVAGDTTTWHYDEGSGLLTNKLYADGNGPSYGYNGAGLLSSRTWARDVVSNYRYDTAGRLTNITYVGDGTPAVNFRRDRMGRILVAETIGVVTNSYAYGPNDLSLTNEVQSGAWGTASLARRYDTYGRLAELDMGAATYNVEYGYDEFGRMNSVASGQNRVEYMFEPSSDWRVNTKTYYTNQLRLASAIVRDVGGRIASVQNSPWLDQQQSFAYQYDQMGRRTNMVAEDGSHWGYGYNTRSEVIGGSRAWSNGAAVLGQSFAYGFDPIGNRTNSMRKGEGSLSWTANELNQYTARSVNTQLHVFGTADSVSTVNVMRAGAGSVVADRQDSYFHAGVVITNAAAPVWSDLAVTSRTGVAESHVSGGQYAAQTPESFTYDSDGNMTQDGRWEYAWDAENRLTQMVSRASATNAGAPGRKLVFAYDYQSRRISKSVYRHNGTTWVKMDDRGFVYDGWNLIRERGLTTGLITFTNTYVWGLDLSGTRQGAGGVGGLVLSIAKRTTNLTVLGYCYDANGNVSLCVNMKYGSSDANYEYGPFGEALRHGNAIATSNPVRFSTKYNDDESGLSYYGFRYYHPAAGRWLNRDPLEEGGGVNVMTFCNNNAGVFIDSDGLQVLQLPLSSKASPSDGIPRYTLPQLPRTPIPPEYQLPPGTPPNFGGGGGWYNGIGGSFNQSMLNQCCDDSGHIVQYQVTEVCAGIGQGKWGTAIGGTVHSWWETGQSCPAKSRWYMKANGSLGPSGTPGPVGTIWSIWSPQEGSVGIDVGMGGGSGLSANICHATVWGVVKTSKCCNKAWEFPPDPPKPAPSPLLPPEGSPIWDWIM